MTRGSAAVGPDLLVSSSIIGAANTLAVTGNGLTAFTGSNTYGYTTISGGTLQIGNGGTTGTLGTGTITDNAALVFNRTDTGLTVANVINGSGSVTQAGAGMTTLSGANGYSGGTNFNAGELSVAADANLGNTARALNFNGGAAAGHRHKLHLHRADDQLERQRRQC